MKKNQVFLFFLCTTLLLSACQSQNNETAVENPAKSASSNALPNNPASSENAQQSNYNASETGNIDFSQLRIIAAYTKKNSEETSDLLGLIDGTGQVLIPFEYTDLYPYNFGYIASKDSSKQPTYFAFDHSGNPLEFSQEMLKNPRIGFGKGHVEDMSEFEHVFFFANDPEKPGHDALFLKDGEKKLLSFYAQGNVKKIFFESQDQKRLLIETSFMQEGKPVRNFSLFDADLLKNGDAQKALIAQEEGNAFLSSPLIYTDPSLRVKADYIGYSTDAGAGVMDINGNSLLFLEKYQIIIPPIQHHGNQFFIAYDENGLAEFIDIQTKKTALPGKYFSATSFYKGYALVQTSQEINSFEIIDQNGKPSLSDEVKKSSLRFEQFGYSDYASYQKAIPGQEHPELSYCKYDGSPVDFMQSMNIPKNDGIYYEFYPFYESLVQINRKHPNENIFDVAIFDMEKQSWLIPLDKKYSQIQFYEFDPSKNTNGFFVATNLLNNAENISIYDLNGALISDHITQFICQSNGLFLIEKDSMWQWIDQAGKIVLSFDSPAF